jgi:hypothetical protein
VLTGLTDVVPYAAQPPMELPPGADRNRYEHQSRGPMASCASGQSRTWRQPRRGSFAGRAGMKPSSSRKKSTCRLRSSANHYETVETG